MTAGKGRGQYAKTAAVRQRIIESCVDAFSQTGFHGATMKDIARRAGISQTGLLHHFPRKDDLLLAMLQLREERSARYLAENHTLDPDSDPIEVLRGMLAVLVDNELQPGLMELHCVLSGEATSPNHPAHTYYTERYRKLRTFYTAVFTALADQGGLESTIDPATLATMTISLINGVQAQWLYDRDTVRVERTIHAFLTSIIPGLAR